MIKLNGATFSDGQDNARAVLASKARHVCIYGGARAGKTFLIVRAIIHRALRADNSRHAILRHRANAARSSISLDTIPKVMRICFPGVKYEEKRQDGYFELPNGAQIWVGGLDDGNRIEKILGQEFLTVYLNEASQISYDSVLVVLTRLAQVCEGVRQRFIVDLNPSGKTHWTNMMFVQGLDPQSRRPLLNPEDYAYARLNPIDNAHNLSAEYLQSLKNLPEKARRRFYDGLFVDEVEGALWTYDVLDKCRREPDDILVDRRRQVVVAVDPSGASGDNPDADPIGIILAARDPDDHGFILADESLLAGPSGPNGWAAKVCKVFKDNLADYVVAERNFGGEMVRSVIHAQDGNVPVHLVTASRGKAVRAEPVSTLYGQGRVHHVGRFETLEDQMCAFTSSGYNGPGSPDHADAAVWALTDLLLGSRAAEASTGRYNSRVY